jgi:hypothetical protein
MDKEGQECLKRFYSHEDLGWKLERIADFYKDEPVRPKVYIKEVSSVLRRFHYYMDRLRTGNKPIITDTEASDTQIVVNIYESVFRSRS